jgi:hypothetical protein
MECPGADPTGVSIGLTAGAIWCIGEVDGRLGVVAEADGLTSTSRKTCVKSFCVGSLVGIGAILIFDSRRTVVRRLSMRVLADERVEVWATDTPLQLLSLSLTFYLCTENYTLKPGLQCRRV